MPRVSVVIPVYNAQKYVAETLNSVLNQTYTDFEIIVVDDGSIDETITILRLYRDKYPQKIRVIQKENGGPGSARNVGISAATGEYIAFNDADDLWLKKKLEKQIRYFDSLSSQVGLVYTNGRRFDENGIWLHPERYWHKPFVGWVYKNLLKENMIPNLSVMVRKKCFDDVGLFDVSREIISSEDYDMWLRISLKYEVAYLDEVLYLYREHPDGINKRFESALKADIHVLQKHMQIVEGNLDLESDVRRALSLRIKDLGYLDLKHGRMFSARQRFNESLATKFLVKTLELKLATFCPYKLLDITNRIFKSFVKPADIVKSEYRLE